MQRPGCSGTKVPRFFAPASITLPLLFVWMLLAAPASICERVALQQPEWDLSIPKEIFFTITDPKTRLMRRYSINARVARERDTGNYALRWRASDAKRTLEAVWTPSTKIEVVVKAEVRPLEATGHYEYRYTVSSGPSSAQLLRRFIVEYEPKSIEAGASADGGAWHSRALPIGLWEGRYWVWSDSLDKQPPRIGPGDSQDGFWIRAEGLPAIVKCYAAGYAADLQFRGARPGEKIAMPFDLFPQSLIEDAVCGVTVGPGVVPPDASTAAQTVVKRLGTYVAISLEQGWAHDTTVSEPLAMLVTQAQNAIDSGDRQDAVGPLRQILERIETLYAEDPPRVTSEAYVLVRYNVEWLLHHLETAAPSAGESTKQDVP